VVPVQTSRFSGMPRIVEVKRKLSGDEKRFDCTVLHRDGSHVVVLFVARAAMDVHGMNLPAGTVTFGHFWTDRPYNVYHWLDQSTGATIGAYFNVSDRTRIADDVLEWRDLDVDVMLMPDGRLTVLDEHEVPVDAPVALLTYIEEAKAALLRAPNVLAAELERHRLRLWPRVSVDGATPP